MKLKLAPAVGSLSRGSNGPDLAILTTPRCDPDSAALRRDEVRQATDNRQATDSNWRKAITFDALGWHLAERCQQAGLLPGDALDIAFTIDNNDHPEYGGLELSLRDFSVRHQKRPRPDSKCWELVLLRSENWILINP